MDLKEYVSLLKVGGKKRNELRADALRDAPYSPNAILALSNAFRISLKSSPPKQTSGLVEFQRLMAKLRS